jgi:hypothetical protein
VIADPNDTEQSLHVFDDFTAGQISIDEICAKKSLSVRFSAAFPNCQALRPSRPFSEAFVRFDAIDLFSLLHSPPSDTDVEPLPPNFSFGKLSQFNFHSISASF